MKKDLWPDDKTGAILFASSLRAQFLSNNLDLDVPIITIFRRVHGRIQTSMVRLVGGIENGESLILEDAYQGFRLYYGKCWADPTTEALVLTGTTTPEDIYNLDDAPDEVNEYPLLVQHIATKSGLNRMTLHRFQEDALGEVQPIGGPRVKDEEDGDIVVAATDIEFVLVD
jgi:hypothetical protein